LKSDGEHFPGNKDDHSKIDDRLKADVSLWQPVRRRESDDQQNYSTKAYLEHLRIGSSLLIGSVELDIILTDDSSILGLGIGHLERQSRVLQRARLKAERAG